MESLGTGGFATVLKAKYRGIDEYLFAMKSMRKNMNGNNMRPSILNELELLNTLDHPNIANFNECYEDETFLHAILEYCPGECLAQIFLDCEVRMELSDILKIFYQICKTAAYLRREEIIHRDYKPANIMVYKTDNYKLLGYQIQLLDFGLARRYAASINDKEIMGSPHYVAPESLAQSYSYSGDVWSIGVMLYFAIALEHPFEDPSFTILFRKIKEEELVFRPKEAWKDIPKDLMDLIESMLRKDPKDRIDIEKIPIHPAFKEIHKIEDSVSLSTSENQKLSMYYLKLDPIQRKFMKYSTKFIPHTEKPIHCEKFTLLDKENHGYFRFKPDEDYIKDGSDDDEESDRSSGDKYKDNSVCVSYSDYLAAILDPDLLCGELNIELLFHTLNPSHNCDEILKKELKSTLFFGTEDREVSKAFEKLEGKNRGGNDIFTKKWMTEYFKKIKEILKNDDESDASSSPE